MCGVNIYIFKIRYVVLQRRECSVPVVIHTYDTWTQVYLELANFSTKWNLFYTRVCVCVCVAVECFSPLE